MRTRSGESVGLIEVLDEAVERARAQVEEKNPDLPEGEKQTVAEVVGIGAVKYAELSQFRMTDYVFAWDKMLALTGNTAPYLQYSYVRTRSIFRRLGDDAPALSGEIELAAAEEIELAKKLAQFAEIVPDVLHDHRPNLLAAYLLEVAKAYHSFFEACPVLRAEGAQRNTRLILCEVASRVLRRGLDLMGIAVTERM
ncbi:MAG: arginine--tRNA ligase [Verrucomicrobiales bacterium]